MSMPRTLYVISEGTQGPVKIGISHIPTARLSALQAGNPRKLNMVCAIRVNNASVWERMLHEELNHHRLSSEWFDLREEFISEYLADFCLANGIGGES